MTRALVGRTALALLALACRAEAPPKSQSVAPPSASRARTSGAAPREQPPPPPVAAASAPAPEEPRFGAIRPVTAPAELERLAFLRRVCEVGVQGATPELPQLFGCTCCPPFEECAPRADDALVENPDHVFGVEAVARGRFTRKDAEQELATFHGCGVSMNGGSIAIIDTTGDQRTTSLYEDFMVVPDRCAPYRLPAGRDLVVCEAVTTNQSHLRVRLVTGDFTKPEKQRWRELVAFEDSSLPACWEEPGQSFVREVLVGRRFIDENADGRLDLELELETQRGVSTQPFIERCGPWLEAGPTPPSTVASPWALLDPPRRDRLVFLFDGSRFVASPATKRVLAARPNDDP